MSGPRYSIIPPAAVFDRTLRDSDLRVLAALGSYTDKSGWCWPKQQELADRLNLSRTTIISALKALSDRGYVQTRPRTAAGRGKVGLEYRVVIDPEPSRTTPPVDSEPAHEKPMSTQADIGKKADVNPGRQRKSRKGLRPMLTQADIGADVHLGEQPMLTQADIGYIAERPHKNDPNNIAGARAPKPKPPQGRYPPDFEGLWFLWPGSLRSKSSKAVAAKRYAEARKRWPAETLLAAAEKYLAETKVDDADSGPWKPRTCYVEVFLNGKLEAAVEAVTETERPATAPIAYPTAVELLRDWDASGAWDRARHGPAPGEPGTRVPEQAMRWLHKVHRPALADRQVNQGRML